MGNTCHGPFRVKSFLGYSQLEDQSISNPNPSSTHSDKSPTSLNSQQLIAQVISKDNPSTLPPISQKTGSNTMRRVTDNQSYFVLDHKTLNNRDLHTFGHKLGQGHFGTTYLSTETSTGVNFTCKSIEKRKLISKEDMEDVGKEIQIMHYLTGCQNIVSIKGAY